MSSAQFTLHHGTHRQTESTPYATVDNRCNRWNWAKIKNRKVTTNNDKHRWIRHNSTETHTDNNTDRCTEICHKAFVFQYAHRLNNKLFRNSLIYNLLFIIVNVSASTEAFFGTVCLIAVHRSDSGWTGCRRCGRVDKTLVSVHRLVLLLPDMYHLLDLSVHSVAFSVDDFGLVPIYDVVEGDSMICDCWLVLFTG